MDGPAQNRSAITKNETRSARNSRCCTKRSHFSRESEDYLYLLVSRGALRISWQPGGCEELVVFEFALQTYLSRSDSSCCRRNAS